MNAFPQKHIEHAEPFRAGLRGMPIPQIPCSLCISCRHSRDIIPNENLPFNARLEILQNQT